MPGEGSRACPKGEKRSTTKRRERKQAGVVATRVRAEVDERDGYCRVLKYGANTLLGACSGSSQWAHLNEHRRSNTRGQEPERRHTTFGSCKLCWQHHLSSRLGYDRHAFEIEYLTTQGADGRLRYKRRDGETFDEQQSAV